MPLSNPFLIDEPVGPLRDKLFSRWGPPTWSLNGERLSRWRQLASSFTAPCSDHRSHGDGRQWRHRERGRNRRVGLGHSGYVDRHQCSRRVPLSPDERSPLSLVVAAAGSAGTSFNPPHPVDPPGLRLSDYVRRTGVTYLMVTLFERSRASAAISTEETPHRYWTATTSTSTEPWSLYSEGTTRRIPRRTPSVSTLRAVGHFRGWRDVRGSPTGPANPGRARYLRGHRRGPWLTSSPGGRPNPAVPNNLSAGDRLILGLFYIDPSGDDLFWDDGESMTWDDGEQMEWDS